MISVCVPTYNSLDYLKIFHKSLKNTRLKYELLVHDNGSTDGTLNWLKENGIFFNRSEENLGFCGVNHVLRFAKHDYIMIFNSDMYCLPGWDVEILKQINKFKKKKIDKFTISCRLIEPLGSNPEYTIFYAGHDAGSFDEDKLLKEYFKSSESWKTVNTTQYSHPILMPRKLMEEICYLDVAYFPGWSVDHDLAAEAYKAGCRNFVMLTSSRVYHFISKTFTQLPKHVKDKHGQDIFEKKWGISVEEFRRKLKIAKCFQQVEEYVLP